MVVAGSWFLDVQDVAHEAPEPGILNAVLTAVSSQSLLGDFVTSIGE